MAIYRTGTKADEISRSGGAVATSPGRVRLAGWREAEDGIEEGRRGVMARGQHGGEEDRGGHTVRARAEQRRDAVAAIRGDSGEEKLLAGVRWTVGS